MTRYHFDATWRLPAGVDAVWEEIWRVEDWPTWWPAIASARVLAEGGPDGVGRRFRCVIRSPFRYRLTVDVEDVQVRRPERITVAVTGQLEGAIRWTLVPHGGDVLVRQVWDLGVTRRWMRLLAPAAGPAFRYSHEWAARGGEAGLRRRLLSRR